MKLRKILTLTFVTACVLLCSGFAAAQSTTQDFPTAVITNEIAGTIKARDIGDSRLTTYFYTFNADQGDIFINIVTKNFTGDIDVFAMPGLRSVTKIVVYANDSDNETGRAVYFRKLEKLLLRIQGRSPNDDPASFRMKFAGSFVAAKESDTRELELPKVTAANANGIRVNSVGTILPPLPKPVTTKSDESDVAAVADMPKEDDQTTEASGDRPKTDVEKPTQGLEVVVTDPTPKNDDASVAKPSLPRRTAASRRRRPPAKTTEAKPPPSEIPAETTDVEAPPVKSAAPKRAAKKPKVVKEAVIDPLASIRLVIAFKDGKTLEKAMSGVFKFSVDKGILTVILKDGTITRYAIVDVAKVTIE